MSTQPTTVFLDVMDTLVYDPFFKELPKFFNMSFEAMMAAKHKTSWLEFERGEIEEDEMLDRFFADRRGFDHQGLLGLLRQHYCYLDGIPRLLQRLGEAGVSMYLLSNYPKWSQIIEDKLHLSHHASWEFVSWKTGVRKPDPQAYLGPVEALGLKTEHCLFVDDRQVNCDAAQAVGMKTHLFTTAESLERALSAEGLLPS